MVFQIGSKADKGIVLHGDVAAISIWEISTQSNIAKVSINYCNVINIVRYSYNKTKIIAEGIHRDFYAMVFIVDASSND